MATLIVAATTIQPNEPAWALSEVIEHKQGTDAAHRYQTIWVARDDRLVEWRADLGPATQWPWAKQFRLIGGEVDKRGRGHLHVYETVGSLQGVADEMRNRSKAEWDALYHDDFDPDENQVDFETGLREALWRRGKGTT